MRGHIVGPLVIMLKHRIAIRAHPRHEPFQVTPHARIGILLDHQRGACVVQVHCRQSRADTSLVRYGSHLLGERALSSLIEILILDTDDTDADGLPDGWELLHFNSLPSTDGTGDADADFISDYDEFVADTDPNDFNHFFIATDTGVVGSPQTAQVTFVSNPTRNYEVEVNESPSLKPAAWLSKTAPFPGEPGQTTWTDTNAVPSSSTGVVYRVRAAVP